MKESLKQKYENVISWIDNKEQDFFICNAISKLYPKDEEIQSDFFEKLNNILETDIDLIPVKQPRFGYCVREIREILESSGTLDHISIWPSYVKAPRIEFLNRIISRLESDEKED